jgi:hypothetical protein
LLEKSSTIKPGHLTRVLVLRAALLVITVALPEEVVAGAGPGDSAAEFFEKEVRPLLAGNCQKCHGGKMARGGLKLTTRGLLLRGGNRGPAAAPGNPGGSLIIEAVEQRGELKMPPTGKLSRGEIDRLKRWIALSLPWPDAHAAPGDLPSAAPRTEGAALTWWAFLPPRVPAPPEVKDRSWPRSEIDRFILAKLEARGMTPASPAGRRTLLRRVSFDLTGLPPTPEEVDSFIADASPDALARVVDRLLASPAYGLRWARHWLDVVRYTDYFYPEPNAHPRASLFELFEAWRYRDWVVSSLDRDLPYDQFILHQIAGDLLKSPQGEPVYSGGVIATGLLALAVFDNGDADKLKIVSDIVDDQIDVVGKAFLGLTLACARCHDHKFDPISQRDYYGLAGIFHSTRILKAVGGVGDHTVALRVPLVPPTYFERRDRQRTQLRLLDAAAGCLSKLQKLGLLGDRCAAWRSLTWRTLERSNPVWRLIRNLAGRRVGPLAHESSPSLRDGAQQKSLRDGGPAAERRATLEQALALIRQRRATVEKELLPEPPRALAAQDGGTPGGMFAGIQDVPIHIRGSYSRLGAVVPRHLPEFFGEKQKPITQGSGRLDLARWIAGPNNPLTARVLVNRVWQHHFGAGLARTPSNFGKLGDPPSHPELLAWLADRFVRDGWSIKKLHRRILLSAVYQESSAAGADRVRQDPENRWRGRASPRRLEAEAIRDSMLQFAGRLDRAPGGPATADLERPRRSLYVQTVRQDRGNFSSLFDAANPEQSVEKRTATTVAPQALFLLNSSFVHAQARHLAQRLLEQVPREETARIERAYRWLYGRPPLPEELAIGRSFLAQAAARGSLNAWTDYSHVLLCSNELIYID